MQDYKIKVENQHVEYATTLFFENYREPIQTFINNVLKNEVGSSDAQVEKDAEGVINIYQTAPDKGWVLAEVDGAVELYEYKNLTLDAKYVVFDGQKLALFIKQEEGKPDLKVGAFLNINEIVAQINSESVKLAVDTVKAGAKNAAIEAKKVEKKIRKAVKNLNK